MIQGGLILVDTSIWIDHLRATGGPLAPVLQANKVCGHAAIIGELACGNIGNRSEVLELLQALPRLAGASDDEALHFIDRHQMMGRDIGYIDAHLLAACALSGARLWSRDKRLVAFARALGLAYEHTAH